MKINKDGLDQLFADISKKIERVDAEIRRDYSGQPVSDIVGPAGRAFAKAGVQLSEGDVEVYALSVSDEKPFQFNLG